MKINEFKLKESGEFSFKNGSLQNLPIKLNEANLNSNPNSQFNSSQKNSNIKE